MKEKPKIIFLVGATATGKSALAMDAWEDHGGEIVNADSVQVYRHVDIGTAKPTQEEREKAPHKLFDFVEAGEGYTAGSYRRDAIVQIEEAATRGVKNLFFVGGSGFYIQALQMGMYEMPKISTVEREEVEAHISRIGWPAALLELQEKDADCASTLSENDHYRIQRALEVIHSTGKTVTFLKEQHRRRAKESFPYEYRNYAIDIDRSVLRSRVRTRAQSMLDKGWIDEVASLRDQGFADWDPMKSVGYLEIQSYLDGKLDYESLLEKITVSTMQLAKKQSTWFRNRMKPTWFSADQTGACLREITHFLQP